MHQGQRKAARGKRLLQERHISLCRTALMTRSINAVRVGAGMNRWFFSQIIAKAIAIRPKTPTAMMVLVTVSMDVTL